MTKVDQANFESTTLDLCVARLIDKNRHPLFVIALWLRRSEVSV